MTDLDEWIQWLENWDIEFFQGSNDGITPMIRFHQTEIQFDDDGYLVDCYGVE